MDNQIYISPKQIMEMGKYPFTMGQIRHMLKRRHASGLHKAVRKIGKRLLIRIDLFEEWVDMQGKQHKE